MWRSIIKYSSWCFVLQALTWMIMAVITIAVIEGDPPSLPETFTEYLGSNIYAKLLMKDSLLNEVLQTNYIVEGEVFEAFAIIQLLCCMAWFGTTVFIIMWLSKNKLDESKRTGVNIWLLSGFAVAFVDLIFTIMLWVDLAEATREFNKMDMNIFINLLSINAIGVVMSVVARGFVLWVVNVGLLCILWKKMWGMKPGKIDWM